MREIGSSAPSQVKAKINEIDTCLLSSLALGTNTLGQGLVSPVKQHYKVVMSAHCFKLVPILI